MLEIGSAYKLQKMSGNKWYNCMTLNGDFIRPALAAGYPNGTTRYRDGSVFVCLGTGCKFPKTMEDRPPDCFQLLCPDGKIGYIRLEMYGMKTKFRKVT